MKLACGVSLFLVLLVCCSVAAKPQQHSRQLSPAVRRQLLQKSYEGARTILKADPFAKPAQVWEKTPAPPALAKTSEKDWESCVRLPILNMTCIELYIYTNNLVRRR